MVDVTRIPLFPLRSVLCPGVALPLHIFEERYRLMVDRCLRRGEDFGVVLIREGAEVGPLSGEIASVGTTAAIRRAGRYPDGRFDILTVGQRRFHLEAVDSEAEPYLVGEVRFLEEPTGPRQEADREAARVGRRFLEYLELLQPAGAPDGPEIEIELEIEVDDDDDDEDDTDDEADAEDVASVGIIDAVTRPADDAQAGARFARAEDMLSVDGTDPLLSRIDASDLSPAERRELLLAAARRLTSTDDPTALSYVLTALIQVDLRARQELLEAPDTVARLRDLDRLLARESWFLRQGLRPIIIDAAQVQPRG
jgi:Lon protease-like protein